MILDCAGKRLDLSRPRVMGILNVTPDSFSDGGRFVALDDALRQAEGMVDAGVDIIDVGGESTRPGALATTVDEELVRVVPVIERLHERFDTPLSIDTSKPEVMRAAVSAGAGMINDVCALGVPGATAAAAALAVPVCLMHMQGEPRTMQTAPQYDDVVADIIQYLTGRVDACIAAGIDRARLLVDPGFGFGKSLQHNLVLLRDLRAANVDIITIGQYLQPTRKHAEVKGFVTPEEFKAYETTAYAKGFLLVSATPLTRSSHHAGEDFARLRAARDKQLRAGAAR